MKAEKNNSSASNEKKMTKYDRKMEARRIEEAKDKRDALIAKVVASIVVLAIIAVIVALVASAVVKKQQAAKAMSESYVKVGNHELTKLEYDFYFNNMKNQFANMYSSLLPYMGVDLNADLSTQQYTEDMTWKDMLDQNTVAMIQNTKALCDDAAANGFAFDETAEYSEFEKSFSDAATSAGISVAQYYKVMYGEFATAANIKPFILEGLKSEAYYNKLIEDNQPSDEVAKEFYEEHKEQYDLATFYNFSVSAQSDETTGEVKVSYEEAVETVKEMAKRVEAGEDFEKLCLEYATESAKPSYEPEDSEFSLAKDRNISSINSTYADWIYDESRKAGDIEVFEDAASETCYIVKFVSVEYDENCIGTIKNTLANQAVEEYSEKLTENYDVVDLKGELVYLLPKEETTEVQATEAETTETQTTEAVSEETTAA